MRLRPTLVDVYPITLIFVIRKSFFFSFFFFLKRCQIKELIDRLTWLGSRSTKTTAIADLRSLLRAFAHYSAQLPPEERIVYSSDIGTVAGFLLVHSPVEEAFWNLVGIVRRLLPGYWSEINCLHGFRKAAAVFDGLLRECDSGVARHLVCISPN